MKFKGNELFRANRCQRCLVCGHEKLIPLFLIEQEGVPHEKQGHKIAYSYEDILVCGKCNCGQLESHSHDCWSQEESWDMYWWYAFNPAGVEALKYLMNDCPSPTNPNCECGIHQFMRHELKNIHSEIPHEVSTESAKNFYWFLVQLDKKDNSVSITLDKKDSAFPNKITSSVTDEDNPALSTLNISGWMIAGTSVLVMINIALKKLLGMKIPPGALPCIAGFIVGQIYAYKVPERIPNSTKIKSTAYFFVMYGIFIGIPSWIFLPKVPSEMQLFSIGLHIFGILTGSVMAYLGLYFGEKSGLKSIKAKKQK